ncbi:hypothetical protein GDO81_013970 [Engystomops pustulosus]|uniref:Uncharacterized protein n=1 Tax=Engystomops pustulosus TaxID=76066 RepID=A0AAV7B753_ENGPU|nr:hypothetical protein GDO81_013970 [Engystomops pustulosus]
MCLLLHRRKLSLHKQKGFSTDSQSSVATVPNCEESGDPDVCTDQCRLVTVVFIGVVLTIPQVYVLISPSSSRFCSQPLLNNLICNIGFTLFTTAFSLILILVEPLPYWLKSLFHTFGVSSFIEGICTVLMTSLAGECYFFLFLSLFGFQTPFFLEWSLVRNLEQASALK